MKKIGFIGVGIMGKSMVKNLMKAGFELHIYARTKSKVNDVIEEGAIFHETIGECVRASEAVITMVGFPQDVEEVYFDEGNIMDQAEKINIYFDDMETSRALREKWKDLDDVAVTTSISGNAEFNAAGVDKGVGLAMLRTKLGIDRMHVIAFGDNENDLEMLEGAGIGVAMGNSKQYVKDAANEVTGDNDHDGVAEFLERFFGL